MKRTIAVAICGLMVLATLIVCFQPKTAITPASNSELAPVTVLPHRNLPCTSLADPAHTPALKDNGCGQPLIEANPTERLIHTRYLPR